MNEFDFLGKIKKYLREIQILCRGINNITMNDQKQLFGKKLIDGEETKFKFNFNSPKVNELTFYLGLLGISKMNLHFLKDVITTYLKEIITNAVKANLKRLYFQKNNADINDPEKYNKLMLKFKQDVIFRMDEFIPDLESASLAVNVIMQLTESDFIIKVINNSPISAEELERINKRLDRAAKSDAIEEAFGDALDDLEGAGLGLVLNTMLLNKSGIGSKSFSISSNEKITQALLKIPNKVNRPGNLAQIQDMIFKEVEGIPTFPATINKILAMCDDPKSDMSMVSVSIEKDPALASDILRIANSAGYFSTGKIESLSSAVTKLGLKVIRQMAVASAARKILDDHFKVFTGFWNHSFQCAFYAKKIVEKMGLKKQAENVYLGGLLHDLGKIALFAVKPEVIEKINGLRVNRNELRSSVLEEISLGISHTEIGSIIAKKWNFSDELTQMIQYHHYPFAAESPNFQKVSTVHLADTYANMERRKGRYYYVDQDALAILGIKNEGEFEKIHNEIQMAYLEIGGKLSK